MPRPKFDGITKGALLKEVKRLGRGTDQIANKLARLEIFGVQGSCNDCPVARYLEEYLCEYNVTDVEIDHSMIWLQYGNVLREEEERNVCVPTPVSVARFIEDFDAGRYPELIESSNGQ